MKRVVAIALCTTALWGCGTHECDASTYVGGCDGQRYSVCFRSSGVWTGEVEELIEGECAADEVCVEEGRNAAGCVLAPATRCDPDQHVGRCAGATPVVCTSPTSWIDESYEVRGSPCGQGSLCIVSEAGAGCSETVSEACPLPAGTEFGCHAGNHVSCWLSPIEGRWVVAGGRTCEHDCVEVLGFPVCY